MNKNVEHEQSWIFGGTVNEGTLLKCLVLAENNDAAPTFCHRYISVISDG